MCLYKGPVTLVFSASQESDFHEHIRQMPFQSKEAGTEALPVHRPCLGSSGIFGSSNWCWLLDSLWFIPLGRVPSGTGTLFLQLFGWSKFLQPLAPAVLSLNKSTDFLEINLHTAPWYPEKNILTAFKVSYRPGCYKSFFHYSSVYWLRFTA